MPTFSPEIKIFALSVPLTRELLEKISQMTNNYGISRARILGQFEGEGKLCFSLLMLNSWILVVAVFDDFWLIQLKSIQSLQSLDFQQCLHMDCLMALPIPVFFVLAFLGYEKSTGKNPAANLQALLGVEDCNGDSKLSIPEGETHLEDALRATSGFSSPEYMTTGFFNEKCDGYKFSALLFQILAGEERFNVTRRLKMNYKDCMKKCIENNVFQARIIGDEPLEQQQQQQLRASVELALKCFSEVGEDRPAMIDVAKQLRQIYQSTLTS
ncbi:Protein kinase family protein [Melia azedarach]|uniref:Protein kinase family protein n=1 Tax=Melia azedarach TaxID=155640 RepID=A0ACC1YCF9_MELAZ|nr:Protein kinase family protein [Melia azedarach]